MRSTNSSSKNSTGKGPTMRTRQRQRLSRRMVILATSSFMVVAAIGLVVYFQFSKTESAYAATSGDYRSLASGNWNSTSTWEKYDGSSWVAATAAPSSSDGVITILSGHVVTVTANATVDQVIINSGGQVTLNSSTTLTIANGTGADWDVSGIFKNAGTVTINSSAAIAFQSGGKYQHNFTTTAGTIPAATWSTGSTCEIIGYTSNTTAPSGLQSFYNFTWNCSSQTAAVQLGGGLTTVNGNFTVTSTGSSELQISNTASFVITVAGDYIQSGGIVSCNTANGKKTTVNVGGNFSHTGGTITHGGSGGTNAEFVFNKSGTQTFTASGNTVSGGIDFTVISGSTLNLGTSILKGRYFTLNVGGGINIGSAAGITLTGSTGNIQVSSTRNYSTSGNYTYSGSSAQNTGNGLPPTINNLTLNNSSGLTLDATVSVTNILTLTSGKITTGSYELQVTNASTSSIVGYSSANYIVGNLRRSVSPSGLYDFPLGTSANYELITANLSGISGFSTILGVFINANPLDPNYPLTGLTVNGTPINDILNYGYWVLTPNSVSNSGTFTVTLNEKGHTNPAINPSTYCVLSRTSASSSWVDLGIHNNSTQSEINGVASVARSGLISLYHFSIGKGAVVLPIELLFFKAKHKDGVVDLTWATASEINNEYFTIERSRDGKTFEEVLRKPGAGNSTKTLYYSATDDGPLKGMSYYRLKQTDYDGKFEYSPVKMVKIGVDNGDDAQLKVESVAPNPFTSDFTVNYTVAEQGNVDVQIFSSSGQIASKETVLADKGFNSYQFYDHNGLQPGFYFVNLIFNGEMVSKKVIKR